eukprot:CAMPEP_0116557428 /NCGR_PEP_ID=MMETSP0397-20121206/9236_1 /TAXON_ID=216820 /ORGANISM="Cyclophora tenuis, Strain ECT3854" /LENGTH=213 /DNA_ID=CAMNT_0004082887 /DNA_START=58 /DNA_END=699 /DNA_ORIENTATION=+
MADINCDHTIFDCTRVCLFDMRAGGAGMCAQLWKCIFVPDGLVEAAVDLIENCTQCRHDRGYDGGCPACLQFGQCLRFNQGLSRSAALTIGKRMVKRIQNTELYKRNAALLSAESEENNNNNNNNNNKDKTTQPGVLPASPSRRGTTTTTTTKKKKEEEEKKTNSPRRKAREKALRKAMELESAKGRAMVVGRPSWPMDTNEASRAGSQVEAD